MCCKAAQLGPRRLILCLSVLVACTPRGAIRLDPAAAETGQVQRVFVGTSRAPDAAGGFGSGRSETVRYARYDVSVPPDRELGEISSGYRATGRPILRAIS